MTRTPGSILCLLAVAAALSAVNAGDESSSKTWTLKSALKQMDKATKAPRGVETRAEFAEIVGSRPVNGSGTIHVSFDGRVRAEIGGDDPRTFLVVGPYLYVYRPSDGVVESFSMPSHPDLMAQYVLLGFRPSGSALKKDYEITLVKQGERDGKPALLLLLEPKSKGSRGIARIELWIDQATWLPLEQKIHHTAGDTKLTIRYVEISPRERLADALFRPDWPEGTKIVRK